MNIILITGIIVAGIVAVIAILAHGKGCKVTALPIVKHTEQVPRNNVTINFKEADDRKDMTFNGDADFDELVDVLGDYASIFANPPKRGMSRDSKLTYIRNDYHDRISRIVNILNVEGINISSYIDMVLTDHFLRYEKSINYLYRSGYHDIC
jgi:hypothetical protein